VRAEDALAEIAAALGDAAQRDVPLARYSRVGIGGPADLLVIARERDILVQAVRLAQDTGVNWRIFGGLTNILLPDGGLRGVVILNHTRRVDYDTATQRVTAESGAIIAKVAQETVRRGWGGLTWAVGLPGTVGGAVVNNAGAFGGEIAKTLATAQILTSEGEIQQVGPDWFTFQYRYSKLKTAKKARQSCRQIVIDATFQLALRDPAALAAKATEYTERRQRTQPPGRTLGSTFKNPPGDYAGRLIEAAGLKGTRHGGCMISEQHANFFINDGNGTAADYQALIDRAQAEVERQFGIRLEPEIEIIAD